MPEDAEKYCAPDLDEFSRAIKLLQLSRDMGQLSLGHNKIERRPRNQDGRHENDSEHCWHTAVFATELAVTCFPKLDTGLISEFASVHELPEIITGDKNTLGLSTEERAAKEADDQEAAIRLLRQLPPHMAQLLERYMGQAEPEARFVRLVDKLTPIVIRMLSGRAEDLIADSNGEIKSFEDLFAKTEARGVELQQEYPEFPIIHMLYQLLNVSSSQHAFRETQDRPAPTYEI